MKVSNYHRCLSHSEPMPQPQDMLLNDYVIDQEEGDVLTPSVLTSKAKGSVVTEKKLGASSSCLMIETGVVEPVVGGRPNRPYGLYRQPIRPTWVGVRASVVSGVDLHQIQP
eukprot:Gb_19008 [translate_table: standard]